jgi:two-component system sensor kinase FixL
MRTLLKKDATRHEPFEVSQAVGDVVKLIKGKAVSRRISIDVDLAADLAPILGDRIQFQQVLLNLLMNACDAVQDIDSSLRRVVLRTGRRDAMALVQVHDRGVGLSDREVALVFEPFYTTKRDGMGLGLSISREIVQAHGGTLEAMRNPDHGMTFSATFPLFLP